MSAHNPAGRHSGGAPSGAFVRRRRRSAACATGGGTGGHSPDHRPNLCRMRTEEVRSFAMSLPETVEGGHGHRPAFRVSKRLIAVIQPGGDDILLYVVPDERQALI